MTKGVKNRIGNRANGKAVKSIPTDMLIKLLSTGRTRDQFKIKQELTRRGVAL